MTGYQAAATALLAANGVVLVKIADLAIAPVGEAIKPVGLLIFLLIACVGVVASFLLYSIAHDEKVPDDRTFQRFYLAATIPLVMQLGALVSLVFK